MSNLELNPDYQNYPDQLSRAEKIALIKKSDELAALIDFVGGYCDDDGISEFYFALMFRAMFMRIQDLHRASISEVNEALDRLIAFDDVQKIIDEVETERDNQAIAEDEVNKKMDN